MTYMSIPNALQPLVYAHRIFCLPSAIVGFDTARSLYVSEAVMEAVCGPFADDGSDDHFIEFRAHLDAFLEGAFFTVSEDPYRKPPETMLARIDPVNLELWDLRSVAPHPGIRCLGAFWEQDVFVALRWNFRENIDWDAEIAQCQHDWIDLFGTQPKLKGASLDEYLTNFDPV